MTYQTAGLISITAIALAGAVLYQSHSQLDSPVLDSTPAVVAPATTETPPATTETETPEVAVDPSVPLNYFVSETFQDVSNTDWYTPFVERVVMSGYMEGGADGLFRPDDDLTLAELAVAISKAFYGSALATAQANYTGDSWAAPYITTLATEFSVVNPEYSMIMTSIPEYEPMNRYEASFVVGMLLESKGVTTELPDTYKASIVGLGDVSDCAHSDLLGKSIYHDVMAGKPEVGFDGVGTLTRGEGCVILGSLLDLPSLGGADSDVVTPDMTPEDSAPVEGEVPEAAPVEGEAPEATEAAPVVSTQSTNPTELNQTSPEGVQGPGTGNGGGVSVTS